MTGIGLGLSGLYAKTHFFLGCGDISKQPSCFPQEYGMKMWNYCILLSRGVSHCGLAKKYPKAKEELWRLEYFTMQKYNLQKILQDIIITL
jgi:hypothetical protein